MELKCTFGNNRSGIYTCCITEAVINHPAIEVSAFVGVHAAGKTNDDVKYLYFRKSVVYFIPRGIAKTFPNLESLIMPSCGLKNVKRWNLIGMDNLKYINLSSNNLNALPANLFRDMKKLKWVALGGNNIKYASSKLPQETENKTFEWIKARLKRAKSTPGGVNISIEPPVRITTHFHIT